uniref:beta-mannosidase n=1 Tax=Ditylenchus dipsaci TaxID=166011 RepID=A0A915EH97_9BILA
MCGISTPEVQPKIYLAKLCKFLEIFMLIYKILTSSKTLFLATGIRSIIIWRCDKSFSYSASFGRTRQHNSGATEWPVDIRNYLKDGQNSIKIEFESPVEQASKRKENYAALHLHKLPPDCTAEVQNGECGAQFLRKIQASFSWDWGPAFPTVGIWKPIFIEYFVDLPLSIVDFYPVVIPKTDAFIVQTSIQLACPTNFTGLIEAKISVNELALSQASLITIHNCFSSLPKNIEVELEVPKSGLEMWYPRGYGAQALYTLTIAMNTSDGELIGEKSKKIGFKTVELVQDLVEENVPEKGRNFYFKVNGIPIFLKGTNWIPVSPFPARNHTLRRQFLLHSMAQANFNTLRVWGGGMYETQDFYELADQLGLLIWHDLMFACALYPTDQAFLNNVKLEVGQQINRLRHHPSILVWLATMKTKWP